MFSIKCAKSCGHPQIDCSVSRLRYPITSWLISGTTPCWLRKSHHFHYLKFTGTYFTVLYLINSEPVCTWFTRQWITQKLVICIYEVKPINHVLQIISSLPSFHLPIHQLFRKVCKCLTKVADLAISLLFLHIFTFWTLFWAPGCQSPCIRWTKTFTLCSDLHLQWLLLWCLFYLISIQLHQLPFD